MRIRGDKYEKEEPENVAEGEQYFQYYLPGSAIIFAFDERLCFPFFQLCSADHFVPSLISHHIPCSYIRDECIARMDLAWVVLV